MGRKSSTVPMVFSSAGHRVHGFAKSTSEKEQDGM